MAIIGIFIFFCSITLCFIRRKREIRRWRARSKMR